MLQKYAATKLARTGCQSCHQTPFTRQVEDVDWQQQPYQDQADLSEMVKNEPVLQHLPLVRFFPPISLQTNLQTPDQHPLPMAFKQCCNLQAAPTTGIKYVQMRTQYPIQCIVLGPHVVVCR